MPQSRKVSKKVHTKITGGFGTSKTSKWREENGGDSIVQKARKQQKLTEAEELLLAGACLTYREEGYVVRPRDLRKVARYLVSLRREISEKEISVKWFQCFRKRHSLKSGVTGPFAPAGKSKAGPVSMQALIDYIEPNLQPCESRLLDKNIYQISVTALLLSKWPITIQRLVDVDATLSHQDLKSTKMITVVECISKTGYALDPFIIWPDDTSLGTMTVSPGTNWNHVKIEKGGFTKRTRTDWLTNVFNVTTSAEALSGPRVLLVDNLHRFGDTAKFSFENNIRLVEADSAAGTSLCMPRFFTSKLMEAFEEAVNVLQEREGRSLRRQDFNAIHHHARTKAISEYPHSGSACLQGIQSIPCRGTDRAYLGKPKRRKESGQQQKGPNELATTDSDQGCTPEPKMPSIAEIMADPLFDKLATITKANIQELAMLCAATPPCCHTITCRHVLQSATDADMERGDKSAPCPVDPNIL